MKCWWTKSWGWTAVWIAVTGCVPSPTPDVQFEARCVGLPALPTPNRLGVEPVFSQVSVEGSVALVEHPRQDGQFYLVTKDGLIYAFSSEAPSPTLFADLSDALAIAPEAGLLDLEFHPDFPINPALFLSYNAAGPGSMTSRISRFVLADDGTLDRASEQVMLEVDQPYANHNGGELAFGPDKLLYVGLGDGGSAGDPRDHGQNTDTLLGAMLRIDVDTSEPYGIPPDNPFAAGGGAPEIWAWGFRNPWRFSFDRNTGALWLGDVGQHRWEEIDVVVGGGNYGWGRKEGSECIGAHSCPGDFVDPVAQYRNVGTASVVGGAVLRGSDLAEFEGHYVFSDFYDGSIWHIGPDGQAHVAGTTARGISSWTLARDGTLYGTGYRGGIYRLVPGDPPAVNDNFPRKLSATGCVDPAAPERPVPWTIPYEVNLPFWSDGADKVRFVAVPEGQAASIDSKGAVQFPRGTVLGKSFWRGETLVETRLLVRHAERWGAYGYAWDEDGRDATLVEEEFVGAGTAAGWIFPGLRGCPACHTDDLGGPLGLTAAQLQRPVAVDGGAPQLAHWAELGILAEPPALEDALPAPDDEGAPLEVRARAYLHVNCSPCHRDKGTGGRADLDLRREVPLADTGLCGEPSAGDLGLAEARIVVPGDPRSSVLLARLGTEGDARMPPVGSAVIDGTGVALIEAWVMGLQACP